STPCIWARSRYLCLSNLQKRTTMKTRFILVTLIGFFALTAFQIIKTSLNVTVRDEVGNTVEGATVQLFKTEEDYNKEENAVAEATTDKKGVAKLKDLEALPYYILVKKGDLNNFGGGEQTDTLQARRINQVTI